MSHPSVVEPQACFSTKNRSNSFHSCICTLIFVVFGFPLACSFSFFFFFLRVAVFLIVHRSPQSSHAEDMNLSLQAISIMTHVEVGGVKLKTKKRLLIRAWYRKERYFLAHQP